MKNTIAEPMQKLCLPENVLSEAAMVDQGSLDIILRADVLAWAKRRVAVAGHDLGAEGWSAAERELASDRSIDVE